MKMDFSSLNPTTSNALNLAARSNDVEKVKRLLKTINPNCVDNRGWTCLHEAAAADSYESLLVILNHPDCRHLAEDHEGCTALQVACSNGASIRTIKAVLDHAPDIANYGTYENVTPLHIASCQGNLDLVQLLIDYGAILDVQDFDGHTALHGAVLAKQPEAVKILLCAGADPEIRDESDFTAFHFACYKGCLESVKALLPYVNNINQVSINGDSPLMLAVIGVCDDVVSYLIEVGADIHVKDVDDDMALNIALKSGHTSIFKQLLLATDRDKINNDIILYACKPHYLKVDILETLLTFDLGPKFFDLVEPFHVVLEKIGNIRPTYLTTAPLNSYLNICEYIYQMSPKRFEEYFYIFLANGVSVNAININECPPLVYIHYSTHSTCFSEVFNILCGHGCNVDYCTTALPSSKEWCIPDAFVASLTSNPSTIPVMLPYSLACEPDFLLKFSYQNNILPRIPLQVQEYLLVLIGVDLDKTTAETLSYTVLPLKHLSRVKVRQSLRYQLGNKISSQCYLQLLNTLKVPQIIKNYLRYK
ncbi:PREDICTED: putative ankyrin repeat protein RF_0381 [Papilio xuthus]|uniref:Ankyrin repeat protein RF_0381 n=1 Tax=Papilio xuthus TaxID=66420 RepID=A0AAJ6ZID0_PAPXU|nr:PREDICTED: putative ankyrin repeat protein RF_0381 [Papilio xuthus]